MSHVPFRVCERPIACFVGSVLSTDTSEALAEVLAATCLAGELSIRAAFSVDQFASAHHNLARSGQTATAAAKPIASKL
jgi:hydroxymethylglutaryl-CoA reductase